MPSTRRSRSGRSRKQPNPKPELFIDRDLGRYKVPKALEALGFVVHPLYVVYGAAAEEGKEDPDWIKDSALKGWVIICRDRLRRKGERPAIQKYKARVFRVAASAKNADLQIEYLTTNINRIVARSAKPGPYIYRVDRKDCPKVWPKPEA